MQILWLTPYWPLPIFGGGTRVYNLIKSLASTCQIDLLAYARAEQVGSAALAELRSFCRSVEAVPMPASSRMRRRLLQSKSLVSRRTSQYWTYYSSHMQERIDTALRATEYDVVILEHSFMGYYAVGDKALTVLDQHNVESDIYHRAARLERSVSRRAYNLLEYVKYRPDEQRICRAADVILAASDCDAHTMKRWGSLPLIVVVPNGVDCAYFSPRSCSDIVSASASVVFVGSMHYAPNAEAMLHFCDEVWPLIRAGAPDATLRIVGGDPPPEVRHLDQLPGVVVEGYVPDVRPYLEGAQVVVAPLRIGGGTRLKIVEALAMGRAIVSTTLGCEGLDVEDGHHLVVADQSADFAAQVIALLGDADRRMKLGRNGRQLAVDLYDWPAIGRRLDATLREQTDQRRC